MKNMTFTGDGRICRKYAYVAHCGLLFLSWLCRDLCVWKKNQCREGHLPDVL